jgi:hypothetical protein
MSKLEVTVSLFSMTFDVHFETVETEVRVQYDTDLRNTFQHAGHLDS